MSNDLVRYSVTDRVALITVNDPDRRNAVTDEMSALLRAAVQHAEADQDVHAVVITGAGKAFCAGADLSALGAAAEEGLLRIYDGFMAVANCILPTIAAVNGAAVGAGLNLALAADVRIAGPHALFDPRFQKLGIHPGGGATWMLQRGVGPQVARAALLFGMRFDADTAVKRGRGANEKIILVREETKPEDIHGFFAAVGILTSRGGKTSHAAVVARGMGKCCVSGAGSIHVDYHARTMTVDGEQFAEGDWISINGSTGEVMAGPIATRAAELTGDFGRLMALSDRYRRLEVRANADTPADAAVARRFGATGIGLCRTEHMFFEGDRIAAVREMILAEDETGRRKALARLLPMQRGDFLGLFQAMDGLPVIIRLLDPPLHEFLPQDEAGQRAMASQMRVSAGRIRMRVEELHEVNPMMGHRGCRLGITYPEITEMQIRAILEAALDARSRGHEVKAEIMIPLVGSVREFQAQATVVRRVARQVFSERGSEIGFALGTMIETPRGALVADSIGTQAAFFSFGTNDLTQMTMGFSRDDAGKFLPDYLHQGIYEHDPFRSIDQKGVGQLVEMAVRKGKAANPSLEMGVCGEHGGDPESIGFFHRVGLDYVSCSPYRVPIARLAAAQAALQP